MLKVWRVAWRPLAETTLGSWKRTHAIFLQGSTRVLVIVVFYQGFKALAVIFRH